MIYPIDLAVPFCQSRRAYKYSAEYPTYVMQIYPRKELIGLNPTVHGGQGWKISGVEDYSANLNPMGAPPGLAEAMASAGSSLGHYPDAECTAVRNDIAKLHGLSFRNIAMGAGSSEIIRNFPFAFLNPGDRVILMRPSFAEYTQQITLAGAVADYFDLLPENGFRIDFEKLESLISEGKHKAVYICNPNNPTGRVESRKDLEKLASVCEEHGVLMFLDETLLDLVAEEPEISLIPTVGTHPNLLICRSFTKSFAVPGIRVGYCVSNPEMITEMQKVRLPWNLGAAEQAAAAFMVKKMDYVRTAAVSLRTEKKIFFKELKNAGLPLEKECDSFFHFVDLAPLDIDIAAFRSGMLGKGFMIRDCTSFGFPTYVRFCVKDRARDADFAVAVKETLDSLRRWNGSVD